MLNSIQHIVTGIVRVYIHRERETNGSLGLPIAIGSPG
jgi:hypothetical protein